MSEGDWSSDGTPLAPPKRKVPLWVWGCGGGCALFLLVAVIAGVFLFRTVGKMADPELNWAGIDEVLPVVERPEGYNVFGLPFRIDGVRMWVLEASDQSHQVMLMHAEVGDSAAETRRELFRDNAGARAGVLAVQGRQLDVLRFDSQIAGDAQGGAFEEMMKRLADGAHANVDLSSGTNGDLLVLMYTERGAGAQIEDEELVEFLSHFRLAAAAAPEVAPEPAPAAGAEDEE